MLVITAQPEHKVRALQGGRPDFVSKPLDLAEVLTRVYNMLEVRLLHLESARLYEQVLAETEAQAGPGGAAAGGPGPGRARRDRAPGHGGQEPRSWRSCSTWRAGWPRWTPPS